MEVSGQGDAHLRLPGPCRLPIGPRPPCYLLENSTPPPSTILHPSTLVRFFFISFTCNPLLSSYRHRLDCCITQAFSPTHPPTRITLPSPLVRSTLRPLLSDKSASPFCITHPTRDSPLSGLFKFNIARFAFDLRSKQPGDTDSRRFLSLPLYHTRSLARSLLDPRAAQSSIEEESTSS